MITKIRLYITVLLSAILFGIGMNMFLIPSKIVSGGFSGIAIVFNIIANVPVGMTVILLNLPFLYMNSRVFGLSYVKRAMAGVLLCGISTQIFEGTVALTDDRLLNSVIGGAIVGCAMGVMFSVGYTTGGTDLVASLLREKIKLLSFGTAIFIGDLTVILFALFVTRDFSGVILAVVSILVQSRTIDYVMKKLSE